MLQPILLPMHIASMLMYVFLLFSIFAQTAVVEVGGGYKFAGSNNQGISFYLRLESVGRLGPQKLLGK